MESKSNNKDLNVIAEQIFTRIVDSGKNIDALTNYLEEDKDYNIGDKPQKNKFIDPITVNYINYYTNYIKRICFEYKNISFDIKIYTKNYEDLSNYIHLIKLGIICCLLDKKEFKEKISLKIDLYLTTLKKCLPQVPGAQIKKEHSKTGYSIFNDNIYICIYRKEEWFKSLIQELFFAFTMDLDGDKIMYKNIMFNNFYINDTFQINNSIIEFCARIFNLSAFLYFGKNIKSLPQFKRIFKKTMNNETMFSVSQSHKILGHFGLKYKEILYDLQDEKNSSKSSSRERYKDESGVFCDFLLPSLLFIHQTRIIQWINFTQNTFFNIKKTERELVIFTHYISHCSKDVKTLGAFKIIEENQIKESQFSNKDLSKNIKFCYYRI